MANTVKSWGRVFDYAHHLVRLSSVADIRKNLSGSIYNSVLPFGLGRSYGDSNLNDGGTLLMTTRLKAVLSADWSKGVIRVQAGITIDELLQISVPKGWFLPVTPGTKFVTIGGAVANNVHGKNHHKKGSFGNFVMSLALHRSDRSEAVICSPSTNVELFELTVGGLGLSGVIEWVEIQLESIESSYLKVQNLPYGNLAEFFELSRQSQDWDYSVAWVDCFAKGKKLGRGVFSRANFEAAGALEPHSASSVMTWPFVTPSFFLNKLTIKVFNWMYRNRPGARYEGYIHYDPFFYPLDGITNWNKLYGAKGFYQHQSIIDLEESEQAVTQLLQTIEQSGIGSFLAVLKVHGPETSPGILSFCKEGVSLALDFPNRGIETQQLLAKLDEIVLRFSGRVYPAKDGHMSAELFQASYPRWSYVDEQKDPAISSSFWRRVTE